MNIILLSGGSGKRLWPLSNDIRSKQFIKILSDENGEPESMVQRVYRQIIKADKDSEVTIATSKKQVSSIHNQLGNKVSVCVEPERRDTFPAIALAVAYLNDVRKIGRDEAVIVCPVDPYVEDDYFESIKKLSDCVDKGDYKLSLMGVEPDFPSEKFGYIIPENDNVTSPVKEFKEKPDTETAKEYIKSGALWNCGVFGFKIGYLLDIAHKLIDFEDYTDLYKKYSSLEKISFDYAVVEKEKSIQALRFNGQWKDLGSWNTFSEQMVSPTLGNVMTDGKCKNTNIINELNIPLIAMGTENTVIAASSDGILVASKEESDKIKPLVDSLDMQVMYEEKSWGSYTVLDVGEDHLTIKAVLTKGHSMTYHSHRFRDEVWTITSGLGMAVIDGVKRDLAPGDVIKMKAGVKHMLKATTELHLTEVQIGKNISVSDKKKFELDLDE